MRAALIEIELLEPALIARKKISYYYETYTYIPAQTLRGALLARLIEEGAVSKDKPYDAELYATSAIPVMGSSRATITHAATLHMDCGERNFVLELDLGSTPVSSVDDVVNRLIDGLKEASTSIGCGAPRKVKYGGGAFVSVKSLMRHGGGLTVYEVDRANVDVISMVGIEIDPAFKRASAGRLYVYNAIRPGTRFRALVFGNETLIERIHNNEVAIGRGSRRGLGRARIRMVKNVDLGKSRVYMALSPVDKTYLTNVSMVLTTQETPVEVWVSRLTNKGLTQERVRWGFMPGMGSLILFSEEVAFEDYVSRVANSLRQGLNVALPIWTMERLQEVMA